MQRTIKQISLSAILMSSILVTGCDLLHKTESGVNDAVKGTGKVATGLVSGTGEVLESTGKAITPTKKKAVVHHKAKKHHHKKHHQD